jgi:hypothetical protein
MLKHILAFVATVASAGLVSGVAYFAGVIYVSAKGGAMGSPLNFVLIPCLVAIATAVSTVVFVAPLSILANLAANRWRAMNVLAPLVVCVLGWLVFLSTSNLFEKQVTSGENTLRLIAAAYFLACPAFLIYWSTLRSTRAIQGLLNRRRIG